MLNIKGYIMLTTKFALFKIYCGKKKTLNHTNGCGKS